MFKKIILKIKKFLFKIHLKNKSISYDDFRKYVSCNLTLENIKRRDFDFNTEIRSSFDLSHKDFGDYFGK